LIDTNSCKATSNDINIKVNPLPVPTINEIKASSELSTGSYFSYQWYLNGAPIKGDTTQKARIFSNGDYSVQVYDSNGCVGVSKVNVVNWYVGIISVEEKVSLKVYPNPSNGIFKIELTNKAYIKNIKIYDFTGKQLFIDLIPDINRNYYSIDLSNHSAGLYILLVQSNEEVYQERIIKY